MPLNCIRKIDARNLTVSDFQQNQANNRPVVLTGTCAFSTAEEPQHARMPEMIISRCTNKPHSIFIGAGLIDSWPALRAWSGDDGKKHLTSLAGKASVQVFVHAIRATLMMQEVYFLLRRAHCNLRGKSSAQVATQVMVSDEGQYRGDMAHRSSMTMTFEDFLSTADRLNGNQLGIQQLYLAQVRQLLSLP